jgi:hypothetical protein
VPRTAMAESCRRTTPMKVRTFLRDALFDERGDR